MCINYPGSSLFKKLSEKEQIQQMRKKKKSEMYLLECEAHRLSPLDQRLIYVTRLMEVHINPQIKFNKNQIHVVPCLTVFRLRRSHPN